MSSIMLTPFETELIETMRVLATTHQEKWIMDSDAKLIGGKLFGSKWGGSLSGYHFPLINSFFGKLQSKNLVERRMGTTSVGDDWGEWALTDLGCSFLGIDPPPDDDF